MRNNVIYLPGAPVLVAEPGDDYSFEGVVVGMAPGGGFVTVDDGSILWGGPVECVRPDNGE